MSNHLRHCPKHRKPLPCPHCALIAASAVVAEPEPKRGRGRPPKYASKEERDVAHAASKREARKRKRERQERRRLVRLSKIPVTGSAAIRRQLHDAVINNAPRETIIALVEELVCAEDMEAYDQDVARERKRDKKRDAVTLSDLKRGASLARGQYLTEAPQGMGLILVGLPGVAVASAEQVRELIGGRRVRPAGFGIRNHERGDARKDPEEDERQFIDKHFRWRSGLRCYRPRCMLLVVGILPQDYEKPRDKWRFHCYLHSPIREFRGHENVNSPI